jgi:CHAT domain-containing protein
VYLNLGLCYEATGRFPGALAAFQQALDLALAIERRDILAEVYYRLASALQRLDMVNEAYTALVAAVDVIEVTREPLRDETLKISLLARWQQIYEALVLHCFDQGQLVEAFAWTERARARAFADVMMRAGQDSGLRTQDSESSEPRTERREPRTQNPEPGTDKKEGKASVLLADLQAALAPGEALVCYFTTGVLERSLPLLRVVPHDNPLRRIFMTSATTLCFGITATELRAIRLPLDPNALVSQSIRGEERWRFLRDPMARVIRQRLIEPLELSEVRRLMLAPHGPLHRVPFAALLDTPIVITPSARFWLATRLRAAQPPAAHSCLAIGYDGESEGYALRHTEAEARFVAAQTGGSAWVGAEPKLPQLRALAELSRWLHIACHGSFDEQAPLASYLVTGRDERISALDVLRDWRLNAELTVLSACQSGVSRVIAGDEPLGLMRAFLSAGARAVLVSQWQIEDLPAFLLMQRFYTVLAQERGDVAHALYAAQRWLAGLSAAEIRSHSLEAEPQKSSDAVTTDTEIAAKTDAHFARDLAEMLHDLAADACPFADPIYWAAFVLVGS